MCLGLNGETVVVRGEGGVIVRRVRVRVMVRRGRGRVESHDT